MKTIVKKVIGSFAVVFLVAGIVASVIEKYQEYGLHILWIIPVFLVIMLGLFRASIWVFDND